MVGAAPSVHECERRVKAGGLLLVDLEQEEAAPSLALLVLGRREEGGVPSLAAGLEVAHLGRAVARVKLPRVRVDTKADVEAGGGLIAKENSVSVLFLRVGPWWSEVQGHTTV